MGRKNINPKKGRGLVDSRKEEEEAQQTQRRKVI